MFFFADRPCFFWLFCPYTLVSANEKTFESTHISLHNISKWFINWIVVVKNSICKVYFVYKNGNSQFSQGLQLRDSRV